jgi:hypothetical protein
MISLYFKLGGKMRLCEHPRDVFIGGGSAFFGDGQATVSGIFRDAAGRDKVVKGFEKGAKLAQVVASADGNAKAAETAGKVHEFAKTGRDVFGFFNVLAGSLWGGCMSVLYGLPQAFKSVLNKDVVILTDVKADYKTDCTALKEGVEKPEISEKRRVNPFAFAVTTWQKVVYVAAQVLDAIGCWTYNIGFAFQKPISTVKKFTKVDEGAAKFASGFPWTMAVNHIAVFVKSVFNMILNCSIFSKVDTSKLKNVAEQKTVARNFGGLMASDATVAVEKGLEIATDATLYGASMSPVVHAALGFVSAIFGLFNALQKSFKPANKQLNFSSK